MVLYGTCGEIRRLSACTRSRERTEVLLLTHELTSLHHVPSAGVFSAPLLSPCLSELLLQCISTVSTSWSSFAGYPSRAFACSLCDLFFFQTYFLCLGTNVLACCSRSKQIACAGNSVHCKKPLHKGCMIAGFLNLMPSCFMNCTAFTSAGIEVNEQATSLHSALPTLLLVQSPKYLEVSMS